MDDHTSGDHAFPPTQWSVMLSARGNDSTLRSEALERICRTYWQPIYAYARKRGFRPADAEDITQGFFAHLFDTQAFDHVREEKGKLRTFLLVSLRNFMANEWRRTSAEKRGGGRTVLSLDVAAAENQTCLEPVHHLTPEAVFERHWASAMLHTVMQRLEQTFAADGKEDIFQGLKTFLVRGRGDSNYREASRQLGLTEAAARVTVHRMRKTYRRLLIQEIAGTLAPEDSVDEELRYLFGVFQGL